MLTEGMLRRLAPRARDDYIAALVTGATTFEEFEINTPNRMAAFLATALHESGGLTIVRENMNYTTAARIHAVWPSRFSLVRAKAFVRNPEALAEEVYGGRMKNEVNGIGDGDGFRYRGGGFFQTTGRFNFERMGKLIGVDLGGNPDLINDPVISLKAACAEASKFNKLADRGEPGFRAYSNGINRGNPASSAPPIGWEDRLNWYRRIVKALGAEETPDDTSEYGDTGALIQGYQKRLAELGYHPGTVDGIFGSHTRAAVLAFQAENSLRPDGNIGPLTRAALNKPDAKPMPVSEERAKATEEDLAKSGSGTIIDAKAAETASKVVVGTGAAKAVQDNFDVMGSLQSWVTDLTGIRAVVDPAIVFAKYLLSAWWIFAIVAGIVILQKTDAIKKARVAAHRLGQNLSR